MEYYLMRRDDIVTACDIDANGQMVSYSHRFKTPELAPFGYRYRDDAIWKWWKNRAAPISQGHIREMLEIRGFGSTDELLIDNLGLSLTDYYWMKPVGSRLRWKDVNLFENDFRSDEGSWKLEIAVSSHSDSDSANSGMTPNSSLRGELEKTWVISNNSRCIIKGNRSGRSQESMNECIASHLHKLQGYDNYTDYELIKIKDKPYEYGCISKAFTSSRVELIPAYDLITSCRKPQDVSTYEHLINVCADNGMDTEKLRSDLEYQIVTDYVLTNVDRHMENVGILRDADTLEFLRLAPIFDSGRSMFTGSFPPYADEEFERIEVNSFCSTESEMLMLVTDKGLVDSGKLPDEEFIRNMYAKDSHMNEGLINMIVEAYKKKVKLFDNWQNV